MEKLGDPLLDYVEQQIEWLKDLGIDWRFPKNFNAYPEEDQRAYILNLNDILEEEMLGGPRTPDDVKDFIDGGPRPPITG
jgi:hypothetical protein